CPLKNDGHYPPRNGGSITDVPCGALTSVLRESIATTGIPALKTAITQRQSYVKSVLDGETVFDTNDGAAKGEIEVLAAEILKIVA
ncbi:hypothetical protein ACWKX9_26390, partial [Enterobacter asburiae]